ncbi:MAG TPA: class I SAM-dependent methyltransferase [Armatimonadota bacterium]|nr:class I SAM-dependent methyltransferase [Armatimonadota bacterium]
MSGYDATTYGERIAGVYDDWYLGCDDAAIDLLAGLAGGGPVLELGIGTGRLALPLVERGVAMHGIDASEAMVAKLRAKPGGEAIPVTMGDFAAVEVEGRFALVFVVFNTLFALASQEEQVACFRNVAAHLEEGGAFVVEAFVPDLARYTRGQTIQATRVEGDHVMLDVTRHDPVHQRLQSQHVVFQESGIRLYPVQLRYAWPSELDLMARLAGLRLRHRWGGWRRETFTAQSMGHVSVYERAG